MHFGINVSCPTCIFYFNFLEFMEVDMIWLHLSPLRCAVHFLLLFATVVSQDGAAMWCIGFQKVTEPGLTILGGWTLD